MHVATLCSQLVQAQVQLLRNNTNACREQLERQLHHCAPLLSLEHPLAAKMLAVKARLQLKEGNEGECEQLQQRVLAMRTSALGMDHEDPLPP
tara:strand:+ start:1146 stop:1424 length:279 start_codon:yes stop_codon:yes gene_type:complete